MHLQYSDVMHLFSYFISLHTILQSQVPNEHIPGRFLQFRQLVSSSNHTYTAINFFYIYENLVKLYLQKSLVYVLVAARVFLHVGP